VEGLACTDQGARTPIVASGNLLIFLGIFQSDTDIQRNWWRAVKWIKPVNKLPLVWFSLSIPTADMQIMVYPGILAPSRIVGWQ
jgi:hypothetical protein